MSFINIHLMTINVSLVMMTKFKSFTIFDILPSPTPKVLLRSEPPQNQTSHVQRWRGEKGQKEDCLHPHTYPLLALRPGAQDSRERDPWSLRLNFNCSHGLRIIELIRNLKDPHKMSFRDRGGGSLRVAENNDGRRKKT